MRFKHGLLAVASCAALFVACDRGTAITRAASSTASAGGSTAPAATATTSVASGAGGGKGFCALPGAIRHESGGVVVVPGAPPTTPDLGFIHLPVGFCAHYFGNVGNARQLRFAPGGELFVASPTTDTTGGGPNGLAAIAILTEDPHSGLAGAPVTFLGGLPSTQGLLFTPGFLYYQDHTRIMRVPYQAGDHAPSGASEPVADITIYVSALHWPKTLDQADDGAIYVGNGGDQSEPCVSPHPFHGGILALDGSPGGKPIAQGCRNPIALRCQRGHDRCFALELGLDYSGPAGGREKLIPIRPGDDWGFPCCASQNLPYGGNQTDCSMVTADSDSWRIGDTPIGLDFEPGGWPDPFKHSVIVALHGAAGPWLGARVVAVQVDPATGLPLPASDKDGSQSAAMIDFATGWDDGTQTHGRPMAVTFAPDGRLFLGNDTNGDIVWIAPLDS